MLYGSLVLFRCPPSLQYRRELIEAFREVPPPARSRRPALRDGVPPRVLDRSARASPLARIAWCVAETDDKDPGPDDLSWEPAGYLRLRKSEYTDEELKEWAGRIAPALAAGSDVFCYFKHEDEGASPKMAKRLMTVLGSG